MRDRKFVLALYEPDIAANTGAMLRSCACFGADAAIVEPAGFVFTDSRFRRAGMDYLDALSIARHVSFAAFEEWRAREGRRLTLLTTRGDVDLWDFRFEPGDVLMVGRESAGVPEAVQTCADARVRIPIKASLRSLNVGVAAAVALAEATRQLTRSGD
jgi:tRNA (cytidine/uridine-2'-O-)-methyltransferase